ncbi:hypothetical protein JMJ77_0000340, partial [Colletotrichum scovillei]
MPRVEPEGWLKSGNLRVSILFNESVTGVVGRTSPPVLNC